MQKGNWSFRTAELVSLCIERRQAFLAEAVKS